MPNLTIYIKNYSSLKPTIFINNREVKVKKKMGTRFCTVTCDAHSKLRIENYHPVNQKFGILISYFFFIISLLGIFDLRFPAREKRILFSADLELNENSELSIYYNSYSKDAVAVDVQGNFSYTILTNQYVSDEKLKKRIRFLNFLKLATWIAFLVIFAIMMYQIIIG